MSSTLLVGEPDAVDLLGHDLAQKVVLGLLGVALLHLGVEVGVDLLSRRLARRGLVVDARPRRPDDVVLHRQEEVEVLERQPHQPEEHPAGQGYGELLVEVTRAPGRELVHQLFDEVDDLALEEGHLLGCEEGIEDAAVPSRAWAGRS